mmetsp:Transcript_25970/g.36406  ORF Transcript_25970/g.36406 Transcript_25970/m.36406 type:complete len:231 (-) Transcript_25970:123-815(-)
MEEERLKKLAEGVPNYIKGSTIASFTALWCAAGIVISYLLAVILGHEKPFPFTSISATADHYPEFVFFRITEISGSWFIFLVWMMVYWWLKGIADDILATIYIPYMFTIGGFVGNILFMLSTTLIDTGVTDVSLHIFCATNFIILSFLLLALCTLNIWKLRRKEGGIITEESYKTKCRLTIFGTILLIGHFVNDLGKGVGWIDNVIEFSAAYMIIKYIYSFKEDWKDYIL